MADTTSGVNGIYRTTTQTTGTTSTPKKELDQESFLKLLTMQLSYQDPFAGGQRPDAFPDDLHVYVTGAASPTRLAASIA